MVKAFICNENHTIHVALIEVEPICGDYCSWCGVCIVCAEPQVHVSLSAHTVHALSYTETEARQRGLEW